MESYEDKAKELENKIKDSRIKKAQIADEESKLLFQLEQLKAEKIAKYEGLSQSEIDSVKNATLVIGRMLYSNDVMFGHLQIINEDPDITEGGYKGSELYKYSIHIKTKFIEDYGTGLSYDIIIKTKSPGVVSIINSIITTSQSSYEDYDYDEESGEMKIKPEAVIKTSWETDWDYHQKFIIKS
jgi:hypothetical protein